MKILALAILAVPALLLPAAHAGMIGTDTIAWYFPNAATVFATDTLAVGSSLSCPGTSPLCAGFSQPATFTISSMAISLTEQCCTSYGPTFFNGFVFSNIEFADGGSIGGVALSSSDMGGISASDVSFTANTISINLEGVAVGSGGSPGVFTLAVTETPEPSSWLLLGAALAAVAVARGFRWA